MDENTQVEELVVPTATSEETVMESPAPSQDPVEEELNRIETAKRTKLEKLEFTRQRVEKQIAEEKAKEGVVDDDDRPLTVREFRALTATQAQETAKDLVDTLDVPDNVKRLTKHHLDNTIKPSGDAQTDLTNALSLVQAVRNQQVAEDVMRKITPRTAPSAASAPPAQAKEKLELTKEQQQFIRMSGLSEEEALKALQT